MTQDTQKRTTAVIAVVEDDESVRTALQSLLRSSGYQVRTYCDALAFLGSTGPAEAHCLISDLQMPDMGGVELYQRLIAKDFHIPTIFITAFPEASPRIGADAPGLVVCLSKPFEADQLLGYLEIALKSQR